MSYDYTQGFARCTRCGHTDYLHALDCRVVALAPARGILVGIALSLPVWAAVAWWWFR